MIFVYTPSLWYNRISYEGSFWLGKETLEMTRKRRKKIPLICLQQRRRLYGKYRKEK